MVFLSVYFSPRLTVCTALSTNPFEEGRYGAVVTCLMPFASAKSK